MKKTLISAVIATFAGTMTYAQSATDQIINDLTSQGFERIEIDNGIGQIKVEAIRGTQKLEVVYDRATGSILKQEVERVHAGEDTRPGVEIRNRDRDFVDVSDESNTSTFTSTSSASAFVNTSSDNTDQLIRDLQDQGFTRIEVENGVSQTKVEAIRGTEKVETVFDRATGDVISQEVETVRDGEDTSPGVEIENRSRDFVDAEGSDDDDDDLSGGRDDDDDDDDDLSSGRDDDDDDDDDLSSGRDDDDDDDDDLSSGRDDDDDDDDDLSSGRDDDDDDDDDLSDGRDDDDDDDDHGQDDDSQNSDDDGGSDDDDNDDDDDDQDDDDGDDGDDDDDDDDDDD